MILARPHRLSEPGRSLAPRVAGFSSACCVRKRNWTGLSMHIQPGETHLWIQNSPESCSIFHWSWIFKKISPLKTLQTFLTELLCPKNKISYAILHYIRQRQAHPLPFMRRQGLSGKQAVHVNTAYTPLCQISLFPSSTLLSAAGTSDLRSVLI